MNKNFFLAAIFLSGIFFTGCGDKKVETEKPLLVKVQKVSLQNSVGEENYSGTVRGRYETNMSFQVSGKIISRNVQAGSIVEAGNILMTIDPKDVAEQSRNAEAQVSAAASRMNLARANFERYSALFKENAISAAMLDQYRAEYDSATANYESAVAQAQQAQNSLGYANLTANAPGIISSVNAEVGQVVAAGQTVLTLIQTDEPEIAVSVPENKISEIQIGMPVTVKFWAIDGIFEGRVREISPLADSSSRTFPVRISLQNPPPEIRFGMTANIFLSEKNSAGQKIILPTSAIFRTGNKNLVWLVKENKLELKEIEVTDFDKNSVAVKGINPGDTVVVAGVHKLREGTEVRTEAEN